MMQNKIIYVQTVCPYSRYITLIITIMLQTYLFYWKIILIRDRYAEDKGKRKKEKGKRKRKESKRSVDSERSVRKKYKGKSRSEYFLTVFILWN